MKILVFVKQVPNTDDVKLDPKTGNLKREGVESIMNPFDANAVELALQMKDQCGASVCVISMGPPQANEVLKKALAMGCDEAFLLSDRAFGGADTLATGYPLAKAAEKIGDYDLLIFGKCSTDAETAQTGPIVAAYLGIPQVTLVNSAKLDGGWIECGRDLGTRTQRVKVKMPAMLAVTGDINQPRYPSPINIMQLSSKPRTTWSAADLGCEPDMIGNVGSPSSTKRILEPPKHDADTHYFTGSAEDIARSFVDAIQAEHVI